MTFRSKELRPTGETTFELVGRSDVKGMTREVVLEARFNGWGPG